MSKESHRERGVSGVLDKCRRFARTGERDALKVHSQTSGFLEECAVY